MSFNVFLVVLVRPWLWATAIGAFFALAPERWWAEAPYLPLPDREVVAWRAAAAYGTPSTDLTASDVISYLTWRRSSSRL